MPLGWMERNRRSFYKLCLSTLVAVYVLIAVGGIVRSSGSGMGCPDWPRCFGQWIPPRSVADLPDDYKTYYSEYRHKKNLRFARYLSAFGFDDTAKRLITDESIRDETDFNATKTWIEYINRLVGATIGILILAVAVQSWRFRKSDAVMTLVAIVTFLLVGFQGWIGSFVVSSNLTPWTVTVHMFLALAIVFLLIFMVSRSRADRKSLITEPIARGWVLACLAVLLIQILMGTKVREIIDRLTVLMDRNEWVSNAGLDFAFHRSFSWVVLILNASLVIKLVKTRSSKAFPLALILLILGTMMSGAGMAYWGVPPVLQPVHLVLATMTFGMLAFLLMEINRTKNREVKNT
jgi:heme a synthase